MDAAMGWEQPSILTGLSYDHSEGSSRTRQPSVDKDPRVASGREQIDDAGVQDNRGRVFVVDDEDFIRDLYKDVFESAGLTVLSASSGDEALNVFKAMKSRPDIIIMDHRMPGKDGIQTTKEILRIDPSMTIVFSSADESVREQALEAGARSFWAKPFPCSLLVQAMLEIVEEKRK